jgi:hypothetical protein
VRLLKNKRKIFENQEDGNTPDNFIDALKKFSRGQIDRYDLQDMDNLISVIQQNPLGASDIIIEFKNDESFFKEIGLTEDDIWAEGQINSSYGYFEFTDFNNSLEDFLEGYGILWYFDEENKEKLKLISDLILPEKEFIIDDDEYRKEFNNLLYDLFPEQIDDIISYYTSYKDEEVVKVGQETINNELEGYLKKIDFEFYRKYDEISTTVANLRVWALRLGITDAPDAMTLVTEIFKANEDRGLGGWSEMMYEFQDDKYFDSENFNKDVERKLDYIIDSLEEEMEDGGSSIAEFLNLKKRILSKFKYGQWYKLPKDPKIQYKIDGLDREGMRIDVIIQHPQKGFKKLNLTEENFYNLLYQLELFDRFDT